MTTAVPTTKAAATYCAATTSRTASAITAKTEGATAAASTTTPATTTATPATTTATPATTTTPVETTTAAACEVLYGPFLNIQGSESCPFFQLCRLAAINFLKTSFV